MQSVHATEKALNTHVAGTEVKIIIPVALHTRPPKVDLARLRAALLRGLQSGPFYGP
jgi:hypothetical protein